MILKQIKLSQPETERLVRIKNRTRIDHWNIICRWAFCWSLAEPSIPSGRQPASDGSIEMSWETFGGEYVDIYEALLRHRCKIDGLTMDQATLIKHFRLHLNRGINYLSMRDVINDDKDLLLELRNSNVG